MTSEISIERFYTRKRAALRFSRLRDQHHCAPADELRKATKSGGISSRAKTAASGAKEFLARECSRRCARTLVTLRQCRREQYIIAIYPTGAPRGGVRSHQRGTVYEYEAVFYRFLASFAVRSALIII